MNQVRRVAVVDSREHRAVRAQPRRARELGPDHADALPGGHERRKARAKAALAREAREGARFGLPQIGVTAERGQLACLRTGEPPREVLRPQEDVARARELGREAPLEPVELPAQVQARRQARRARVREVACERLVACVELADAVELVVEHRQGQHVAGQERRGRAVRHRHDRVDLVIGSDPRQALDRPLEDALAVEPRIRRAGQRRTGSPQLDLHATRLVDRAQLRAGLADVEDDARAHAPMIASSGR